MLDAVFQALASRYPGIVRGANFNAIAIYYQSVTSITRYYPPIGLLERAPPNLVISSGTTLASPMMNPERKTVWSGLRQDEAGQGLIVTAWTPVYSGSGYRGVIGVDLSVAKLIDVVDNEKVTPNGYSFYVDRNGSIMRSQSYDLLKREMDDGNDDLTETLRPHAQQRDGCRPADASTARTSTWPTRRCRKSAAASPSSRRSTRSSRRPRRLPTRSRARVSAPSPALSST